MRPSAASGWRSRRDARPAAARSINALAFADLNANRAHSAKSFIRTMSQVEFTFNWFYADDRDIAMYSSGRLPLRDPAVDPGLPTIGTGRYEWRGFLPARAASPADQSAQRRDRELEQQACGRFRRLGQQLGLRLDPPEPAARGRDRASAREHTLTSVVAAMNKAATQDLRAAKLLRPLAAVLETGPPPNARAARMLKLLRDWRTRGASRLDRTLDGKIDHPGAAIMDAAWPRIADAVMGPVLGPQLGDLAELIPPRRARAQPRLLLWRGLVRLRRQGPAHGARPARKGTVQDPLLRTGRARRLPRLAVGGARRRRRASSRRTQGPNPNAWRADADARADRLRAGPARARSARCAGPTGRRSSR